MKLLLQLSIRNLFRHKRRNGLLLLAIAVAVAGVTSTNTLIRGMQYNSLEGAVENMTGHVKGLAAGYRDDPNIGRSFVLPDGFSPNIGPNKLLGWAPRIKVPAVIMSERETRGVQLVGIDPGAEDISFVGDMPIDGEMLNGLDDRRVLVGRELARQLETELGKRLVLIAQGADGLNRERGFRIGGIYDAEGVGLEKQFVFVGLGVLQKVLESETVTEVSLRLVHEADRELAKERLSNALSSAGGVADIGTESKSTSPIEVKDWRELEPQAAAMYLFADSIILIWFFLMMSALTFGLVNTLAAAVMERARELGMLRALGMPKRTVVLQVVLESSIMMFVGVVVGIAIGCLLYGLISDGIDLSAFAEGMEQMNFSTLLTPVLLVEDLILVGSLSLGLGVLASLYPAWRVVKIKPLDALRG